MALVVGTDTYATLADIQAWNDARGYTGTITEAAVLRAMDYIENLPWNDPPVDEDADLYWGDDPPKAVINALCLASRMEQDEAGVLMPSTEKRVASESVDVISVSYESGGSTSTFPALQRFLRGYVQGGNIITVRLA